MTARLRALCALIERTQSFIDVGCDHGQVVRYVYEHGLADKITACDISAASLCKAKALLGATSAVSFVCADGFTAAAGHETVCIAGMGGRETVHILSGCDPRVCILSPQSEAREVRAELLRRGYGITFDRVIADGGKYYDILRAEKQKQDATDDVPASDTAQAVRLRFGMFADKQNDALREKLLRLRAAYRTYPPTEENVRILQETEEALRWQQRYERR